MLWRKDPTGSKPISYARNMLAVCRSRMMWFCKTAFGIIYIFIKMSNVPGLGTLTTRWKGSLSWLRRPVQTVMCIWKSHLLSHQWWRNPRMLKPPGHTPAALRQSSVTVTGLVETLDSHVIGTASVSYGQQRMEFGLGFLGLSSPSITRLAADKRRTDVVCQKPEI